MSVFLAELRVSFATPFRLQERKKEKERTENEKEKERARERKREAAAAQRVMQSQRQRESRDAQQRTEGQLVRVHKTRLAQLHHLRSVLLYAGWRPWRRLLELQAMKVAQAIRMARQQCMRRVWTRWHSWAGAHRENRVAALHRIMDAALQRQDQRSLSKHWEQWRAGLASRTAMARTALEFRSARVLQRQWRLWLARMVGPLPQLTYLMLTTVQRQQQEAYAVRQRHLTALVKPLADRVLLARTLRRWNHAYQQALLQKTIMAEHRRFHDKANAWIEDLARVSPEVACFRELTCRQTRHPDVAPVSLAPRDRACSVELFTLDDIID